MRTCKLGLEFVSGVSVNADSLSVGIVFEIPEKYFTLMYIASPRSISITKSFSATLPSAYP